MLFIFLLFLCFYLFLKKYYVTEDVVVKEVQGDKVVFESSRGEEITLRVTKHHHNYVQGLKGQVSFHGETIVSFQKAA